MTPQMIDRDIASRVRSRYRRKCSLTKAQNPRSNKLCETFEIETFLESIVAEDETRFTTMSHIANDNQSGVPVGLLGRNEQNSEIDSKNHGNGLLEEITAGGGRGMSIEFSPKDKKINVARYHEAFEKFRRTIQNKLYKMLTKVDFGDAYPPIPFVCCTVNNR